MNDDFNKWSSSPREFEYAVTLGLDALEGSRTICIVFVFAVVMLANTFGSS